jgi:ferredoxin-NADP reductase
MRTRAPRGSNRGFDDEPFVDELVEAALNSAWLDVHLHDTTRLSRLTADDVVTVGGGSAEAITVLACGSAPLISSLGADLIDAGLAREKLRTEAFAYR